MRQIDKIVILTALLTGCATAPPAHILCLTSCDISQRAADSPPAPPLLPAPDRAAPPRDVYVVGFTDEFDILDVALARTQAGSVLAIAIDHVGIPRGIRGHCLVQGRVIRVVRGTGPNPGGLIEVSIPCTSELYRSGSRRILMRDIREGESAQIYLDARQLLLDFEPLSR